MKVERTIVIKENEISEEVGQYEKEITKLLAEILMKTENIMVDKSDSLGYTSQYTRVGTIEYIRCTLKRSVDYDRKLFRQN